MTGNTKKRGEKRAGEAKEEWRRMRNDKGNTMMKKKQGKAVRMKELRIKKNKQKGRRRRRGRRKSKGRLGRSKRTS